MIRTRKELKEFIQEDALANRRNTIHIRPLRSGEEIWSFIVTLRKLEYHTNNRSIFSRFLRAWYFVKYRIKSRQLGFSIPINTCDSGLSIAHYGCVVVNKNARIGKNCRIHEGVTIGTTNGSDDAPVIGKNVFIASGAKIIGNITIADDVCIGANAVVVKSVEESGITVAGIPAKKISNNNSHSNLSPMLNLID